MVSKTRFILTAVLLALQSLLPLLQRVTLAQSTNQIVYASGQSGTHQLYLMNADGSSSAPLTSQGDNIEPNWSPDRRQIAFTSDQGGMSEIHVINANGSGERTVTEGGGYNPSWSADGHRLAFISDRAGNGQLFVTDLDNGDVQQLTTDPNAQASAPAWSPDNQRIAFVYNMGGASTVWLINDDGGNLRQITHDQNGTDYGPAWSPDGSKLAYISTVAGDSDLLMVDIEGGQGRQIATLTGRYADNVTWSEDGTRLAFTAWARHGARAIFVVTADGSGNLRQLSQAGDDAGWPSWASLQPVSTSQNYDNRVTIDGNNVTGNAVEINGTVDTGRLNLRNGPGPDYGEVGRISDGDPVTLLGRDTIGRWVQIRATTINVVGWVNSRYLVVEDDVLRLSISWPLSDEESPTQKNDAMIDAVVNVTGNDKLSVRGGPGRNFTKIDELKHGASIVLIARNGSASWVQIQGYDNGWVNSIWLKFDDNVMQLPLRTG